MRVVLWPLFVMDKKVEVDNKCTSPFVLLSKKLTINVRPLLSLLSFFPKSFSNRIRTITVFNQYAYVIAVC